MSVIEPQPGGQLLMRHPVLQEWATTQRLPLAPPEGYAVREASSADAEGLARLLSAAFDADWDADWARRTLTDAPDVLATYVVVVRDGAVVATASARLDAIRFPEAGYVHYVASAPAHRGRRLGALVTARVLRQFAHLGYTEAILETDDHRRAAIRSYLRLGFIPVYPDPTHGRRWSRIFATLFEAAAAPVRE